MAYYLQFDGVNQDVTSIANLGYSRNGNSVVTFEIDFSASDSSFFEQIVNISDNLTIDYRSANDIRFQSRVGRVDLVGLFADDERVTLSASIDRSSGETPHPVTFRLNGNVIGTASNFLPIEANRPIIFTPRLCPQRLYGFRVIEGGVVIHNYDPTASRDQGVLVDTASGNDGTPANFPANFNDALIFYDDGGGAVTSDVTEVSTDAIESSSISISANITAQVTELSGDATESSVTAITNNLVTADVTELSTDFSESAVTSFSGSLSAIITELAQDAAESSSVDISANISAAITELAQDFADNAAVNLVGSFTVEVTETTTDFDEACYVQLPVQRLTPRKTISVNARRSGRISVNARRSQTIKVR